MTNNIQNLCEAKQNKLLICYTFVVCTKTHHDEHSCFIVIHFYKFVCFLTIFFILDKHHNHVRVVLGCICCIQISTIQNGCFSLFTFLFFSNLSFRAQVLQNSYVARTINTFRRIVCLDGSSLEFSSHFSVFSRLAPIWKEELFNRSIYLLAFIFHTILLDEQCWFYLSHSNIYR